MPALGGVASAPYSLGPLDKLPFILRHFVRTSYDFRLAPVAPRCRARVCRAVQLGVPRRAWPQRTPTRLTSTRPCDTLYPQCVSRDAVVPCSSTNRDQAVTDNDTGMWTAHAFFSPPRRRPARRGARWRRSAGAARWPAGKVRGARRAARRRARPTAGARSRGTPPVGSGLGLGLGLELGLGLGVRVRVRARARVRVRARVG